VDPLDTELEPLKVQVMDGEVVLLGARAAIALSAEAAAETARRLAAAAEQAATTARVGAAPESQDGQASHASSSDA
jgi:hypothetical protein